MAGEVLAGKGKFFEIIFQEEPGALRIAAIGKDVQKFRSFRYFGLGIRQFPAQIGLGAVCFG